MIAFETIRTGFSEVWAASRDDSDAAALTRFENLCRFAPMVARQNYDRSMTDGMIVR
jgi:hypothetical protein